MTDNQEVKFCVNCKHHLFNPYSYPDEPYYCGKDFTVNLVDSTRKTKLASTTRQDEGKCGKGARWFELIVPVEPAKPKGAKNLWMPTLPQKLKDFFK